MIRKGKTVVFCAAIAMAATAAFPKDLPQEITWSTFRTVLRASSEASESNPRPPTVSLVHVITGSWLDFAAYPADYMREHWEQLTLYSRVPGVALDNNICERALQKAILHRKHALFYKSENGAHVGGIFMSLIHTAELCEANPFDYLVALQKHADAVEADPPVWMPWNYTDALARLDPNPAAPA